MPSVLIRTPHGGPWLELDTPAATLTADRPDGIAALLAGVEDATAAGYLAAGYVAYDAAAAFGLPVRPGTGTAPLAWFGLFSPETAVRRSSVPGSWQTAPPPLTWHPTIDQAHYAAAVAQLREDIGEGNAYQLNYTFRMRTPFEGDARALFAALAGAQSGDWAAFIDTGEHVICSASPELFFQRDGQRIVTRPMKGTAPRGRWPIEDAAQSRTLAESAKNRAENVMIVDLMRNDLGRIAAPGSVAVTGLFDVERYPAQWQMTSTVEASLLAGIGLPEIFAALFPAGSVTGAPKIRSMQILSEIEDSPRGVYCGAIGLAGPGRQAHFNVAIRTVVIDRRARMAEFGVGSGIVWDSEAATEFEECRVKSAILTTPVAPFDLIESLCWEPAGGYTLLARHRDRMAGSAAYFDRPFDATAFDAALTDAAARLREPAKVRIRLSASGALATDSQTLERLPSPMRVALAPAPTDSSNVFLFHKTTQRDVYATAEASRPADADTVLLWNERGEVTEALHFNLVAQIDGRRVTPPVGCGLLPGTLRAELLDTGDIAERPITVAELRGAPKIWLINSVRGWVDAVLVSP